MVGCIAMSIASYLIYIDDGAPEGLVHDGLV